MALALTVDSLDTVPEALRAAYVPDGDKFKLDAEIEDTAGLKSALQKERDLVKTHKAELAAFKKTGKTPEEIAEFAAAQEAAAAELAKKSGNFDSILKQKQDAWAAEKAAIAAERDAAFGSERSAIIENRVMTALTKAKATGEGMDLLTERLGKRIHIETVDGKRVTTIMQADGKTPLAGSGTDGAATYDDLVTEAKKSWPSLFEGTGAGGSGTPNGKGGKPGDKTITRAAFDALGPLEKAATSKTHKIVD